MRMALRYVASTGSKWILMTVLFPVCMLSGCITSSTIPGRDLVRTPDGVGVPGEPRIEPSSQETIVEIPVTASGLPTPPAVKDIPVSTKSLPGATSKSPQPAAAGRGRPELDAMVGMTKNYTGKPISLDLQEAEIKNVLRLLADVSGTNIAVEPDVEGRVTLKVNRVPWDQVLDMILAMNNLGKDQFRGVIRIARQEKLKKELYEKEAEIRARQQVLESSREVGEIAHPLSASELCQGF